jgi:hypothetical protein
MGERLMEMKAFPRVKGHSTNEIALRTVQVMVMRDRDRVWNSNDDSLDWESSEALSLRRIPH